MEFLNTHVSICSQLLNNMGLNGMGPLIHRFLSINTY